MVSLEDFIKLDLRVGRVLEAEAVEGSDKLLRLVVDMGDERRQIVAGIGKFYPPRELADRLVVIAANLEPKVFMGLESQGMILAADCEGTPVLLKPEREVPAGAKVK